VAGEAAPSDDLLPACGAAVGTLQAARLVAASQHNHPATNGTWRGRRAPRAFRVVGSYWRC